MTLASDTITHQDELAGNSKKRLRYRESNPGLRDPSPLAESVPEDRGNEKQGLHAMPQVQPALDGMCAVYEDLSEYRFATTIQKSFDKDKCNSES
ncbi:unnamed protein product [Fusarium fujikuroi]|uniref:Uncharacterized protein n=1 Tax=Fusarium fujikuroi TaxID=5127 RepID=A0A9Q9U6T9_FUSFU|nr:uncharacterized protein FFM5_11949 [Fusarium fujikuroi]VTT56711.1 unnamed protein product [Fusarium fujikuroi]VTT61188.1 unnamed protein product [Fusarium fujikuroi]VZH89974.1 unnamed protein product [Fusarium fujikuroi]